MVVMLRRHLLLLLLLLVGLVRTILRGFQIGDVVQVDITKLEQIAEIVQVAHGDQVGVVVLHVEAGVGSDGGVPAPAASVTSRWASRGNVTGVRWTLLVKLCRSMEERGCTSCCAGCLSRFDSIWRGFRSLDSAVDSVDSFSGAGWRWRSCASPRHLTPG